MAYFVFLNIKPVDIEVYYTHLTQFLIEFLENSAIPKKYLLDQLIITIDIFDL